MPTPPPQSPLPSVELTEPRWFSPPRSPAPYHGNVTTPIDREYTVPLYSQADVARIIVAPISTVNAWATGYTSGSGSPQPPLLTGVGSGRGNTVSFLALAEAYVINTFRRSGLPLQRIRPAVEALREGVGVEYALASELLATDGAEVLLKSDDPGDQRLVVLRNGQAVFREVVDDYLQFITFGDNGFATRLRLPQFTDADVTVTPTINGGRPTLTRRGIALVDVLGRVRAGEPLGDVADDYGLTQNEVLYLNRAAA